MHQILNNLVRTKKTKRLDHIKQADIIIMYMTYYCVVDPKTLQNDSNKV